VSKENVELVREAFQRGLDGADQDAFEAALDPEIEWLPVAIDPEYRIHRGVTDVRAWVLAWGETFPDLHWETERVLDAGGERVVVVGRLLGRGGASGLDVASESYAMVVTVRDGKIVHVHEQATDEALKAVGLEE
jgi:ketosteroid isomerase-like protein